MFGLHEGQYDKILAKNNIEKENILEFDTSDFDAADF